MPPVTFGALVRAGGLFGVVVAISRHWCGVRRPDGEVEYYLQSAVIVV